MSVAQVLLALQALLGQQVVHRDPKGLKAFQVLQGLQEQLEQQGLGDCKALRACQGRQEQQAQWGQQVRSGRLGQQGRKGLRDPKGLLEVLGLR
jgi:hypothetical protein